MTNINSENSDLPLGLGAKAEGSFIAFAAGDAIGWPVEFPSKVIGSRLKLPLTEAPFAWKRKSGGQYQPYEESIAAGCYSDDTQMLVAVSRSRLWKGNSWWNHLAHFELPLWTIYERGGGGATKRAAQAWLKGDAPWESRGNLPSQYFNAGGNGVAMRALAHAVHYSARKSEDCQLVQDTLRDGVITHGHPRALVGAALYAFIAHWFFRCNKTVSYGEAIEHALRTKEIWGIPPTSSESRTNWWDAVDRAYGQSKYRELWMTVCSEVEDLLQIAKRGISEGAMADDDQVLKELGAFGREKGSGTITAVSSIYLASRFGASPVKGVLRACNAAGADTDTLAAMTGGLLGALCGFDWIPTAWLDIQDASFLRNLARQLTSGSAQEPSLLPTSPIRQRDIDTLIESLERGEEKILIQDRLWASVVREEPVRQLAKSTSTRAWTLKSADGQTLFASCSRRRKAGSLQERTVDGDPQAVDQEICILVEVENIRITEAFYVDLLGRDCVTTTDQFVKVGSVFFSETANQANKPHGISINITVSDFLAWSDRLLKRQKGGGPRVSTQNDSHATLIDPNGIKVTITTKST